MKKALLIAASLLLIAGHAAADDFTVNCGGQDINFSTLTDSTVAVAPGAYTGAVAIPETVTHDGVTYTVTELANNCFNSAPNQGQSSGLTHISLPSTLLRIGGKAFFKCVDLDSLTFHGAMPPTLSSGAFLQLDKSVPLIVPCGSRLNYKNANNEWNSFTDIRSECSVHITVDVTDTSIAYGIGGGYYEQGEEAFISISPLTSTNQYGAIQPLTYPLCYGWTDGVIDNPRSIVVDGEATYTAIVKPIFAEADSAVWLDANNIRTTINALGCISYDGQQSNYHVPANANTKTIFANGLWIGGQNDEQGLHLAASRYFNGGESDFLAGPLTTNGTTTAEEAVKYHRVWRVTRDEIDYHIAHAGDPGYEPAENIATWPANGNMAAGYDSVLAPFYDADGSGRYNPRRGDYPLIKGDVATYTIYNDFPMHTGTGGQRIGVEIHAMYYAFDEPDDEALNNTVFANYKFINRGDITLHDTYMALFTDVDLGNAYDDYVGCDVQRSAYYFYNGADNEMAGEVSFTGTPPAQGCAILAGPRISDDGTDNPQITALSDTDPVANYAVNGFGFGDGIVDNERIGMTNFMYYNNSVVGINSEPIQPMDYYYYMRSMWKNGAHAVYGNNAIPTGSADDVDYNFMFCGNSDPLLWGSGGVVPSNFGNWDEFSAFNVPGDRRGVASSGPFTFMPGQVENFDIAYTTAFSDNGTVYGSVNRLGLLIDSVRLAFAHDTTRSGKSFTYMPYSPAIDVAVDNVEQDAMLLYPNPTTDRVTIVNADGASLTLYDMTGRKVLSAILPAGRANIDLSPLPSGVYLVKMVADGASVSKKLVVTK